VTELGYDIERTFDAPRELVWSMWTQPEHFSYWWGGTAVDVPLDRIELDARPGGIWKATMVGEGWGIDWVGEFREADEPSRLVIAFTDDDSNPARDTFTVVLTEDGDKTHMLLQQRGGGLTAEQYEQAREGTAGFMDALAERLAAVQQR
jgi:uncharacterized protein YndB with AHSA1/START domain